MHEPSKTTDQQVAESVESLRATLRNAPASASPKSKEQVEKLIEIGEEFLKRREGVRPQAYDPLPHKLSLSISPARIAHRLKVMAGSAVVLIVLVLIWNLFFR